MMKESKQLFGIMHGVDFMLYNLIYTRPWRIDFRFVLLF